MGLDMYLTKRTDVKNWNFKKDTQYKVAALCNGKPIEHIDASKISAVNEDFMYWRKANHIHGWFVENVQGGEDDCKEYYVEAEHLLQLRDACAETIKILDGCKKVKQSVNVGWRNGEQMFEEIGVYDVPEDADILKPVQGFFFGGSLIGDYFYQQTKETLERLNDVEKVKDDYDVSFYYQSSW